MNSIDCQPCPYYVDSKKRLPKFKKKKKGTLENGFLYPRNARSALLKKEAIKPQYVDMG